MSSELKQVLEKLEVIQSDLDYLKGHFKDVDMIMTDDDLSSVKEAEKDLKEGRTKRLV